MKKVMAIKPGHCYKISGNLPKRIHIRAIIDDSHVAYAYWRKGFWSYACDSLIYLELLYKGGSLKAVGNSVYVSKLERVPNRKAAFVYRNQ